MATDKKAVSVLLDVEILDALDKECERQTRSRANLVGIIVHQALAELSEQAVCDWLSEQPVVGLSEIWAAKEKKNE